MFLGEWGAECKSLQLNCRISVYVQGLLPPGKEGEGFGGGGGGVMSTYCATQSR